MTISTIRWTWSLLDVAEILEQHILDLEDLIRFFWTCENLNKTFWTVIKNFCLGLIFLYVNLDFNGVITLYGLPTYVD